MRVAMVAPPFISVPPRKYGGTELVVHALMAGLAERGVEVTLFASGDSSEAFELASCIPKASWPPDPLVEAQHNGWAFAEIAKSSYDIVHVHSPAALSFCRLLSNTPFIYTVHHERDRALDELYSFFKEPEYVFISHRQLELGGVAKNGRVVYHGLIPEDYPFAEKEGKHLLCLGRIARSKGTHAAIDFARKTRLPLVIGGIAHEPEREYFNNEVAPRLTGDGVRHLGEVGGEEKFGLLRDAIALVFPIEWEEPFGLVMIEAMLCGTPVVAYSRGSTAEVIDDGVTGFLVEPGNEDAFCRAIKNVGFLDRRKCRERAIDRFGHRRMTDDYLRIYREVSLAGWAQRDYRSFSFDRSEHRPEATR